ncbi:conjugal transfer protein TrbI [Anabaenopsis tanganyikae CS-531]|uniref:Conjugal transfer protein TrbI n=2 Tax=Anabaenopsis TaxID=110103 RepID=A0ABT6KBU7_9CYAN|nr:MULTISPECIES: conjugal transfer protein TrbI [Anabaenopsis]MDB9540563.1 conjugal transfer protein TrbI [Anabaenopsis arnoldii]MDH6092999.1 conjugal transfer protein TrbI [Anabaenopsis arnoldii]MDH6105334.1 conjugal transfer protein TrbI [Anabaenopsis tanganyikae CS-531]
MNTLHQWKYHTAALVAMAITSTVTPMMAFTPANAQYTIGQTRTVTIPANANVSLPVTHEKERVVVVRGETLNLTLKISNDIIDNRRNILIPRNTEVVGQLEPVYFDNRSRNNDNIRGVRFVARELVFTDGRRQLINASSQIITRTETINKNDSSKVLTDAAIGAGAATAISLITGNRRVEVLEPLGGAAAGALASVLLRKQQVEAFVLRPEQDLRLGLNSNLVINL